MRRIAIQLRKPMPAAHDCLPHAAMNLGTPRSAGTMPLSLLVHQIVIQEKMDNWVLYRLDEGGGFIGDTWHGTLEDALHQAKREFGLVIRPSEVVDV